MSTRKIHILDWKERRRYRVLKPKRKGLTHKGIAKIQSIFAKDMIRAIILRWYTARHITG